jgi:hypothetical protein
MPWKECHVMDERVRFIVACLTARNGDAVRRVLAVHNSQTVRPVPDTVQQIVQ